MSMENLPVVIAVALAVPAFMIAIGLVLHSIRIGAAEDEFPRALLYALVLVVCGCALGLIFYYTVGPVLAGEL